MLLHLFTRHGSTFTFHDVTNLTTNETTIAFDYAAQSDGKTKHGTFFVTGLAGWSCHEPPAFKGQPHAFKGRTDRVCEICGHPDRALIHSQ
jgi:hypothetical protein